MIGTERMEVKSRNSRGTASVGGFVFTSGKKTGARFRAAFPETPSPARTTKSIIAHSSISTHEETHGTRSSPRASRR